MIKDHTYLVPVIEGEAAAAVELPVDLVPLAPRVRIGLVVFQVGQDVDASELPPVDDGPQFHGGEDAAQLQQEEDHHQGRVDDQVASEMLNLVLSLFVLDSFFF